MTQVSDQDSGNQVDAFIDEFDRWMAFIDAEREWLVSSGKLPAKSTGRYAENACRLGLASIFDPESAARVLQIDLQVILAAIRSGELRSMESYGLIHVAVRSIYEFGERHETPGRLPQGGDWTTVPETTHMLWRSHHRRHVLRTVSKYPTQLAVATAAIAEQDRLRISGTDDDGLD